MIGNHLGISDSKEDTNYLGLNERRSWYRTQESMLIDLGDSTRYKLLLLLLTSKNLVIADQRCSRHVARY
jgi:DNA repair protein RadC